MNKISTFLSSLFALFGLMAGAHAQCAAGELSVTAEVSTDNWGYELYWEVTPDGDACGINTIAFFGNPGVGCAGGAAQTAANGDAGAYPNNDVITEDLGCMTDGVCVTIYTVDDWGDGSSAIQLYVDGIAADLISCTGAGDTTSFCPAAPASFDASISTAEEYTIVPIDQITSPFGASGTISNVGAVGVTNVSMTTNVYDASLALLYTATSNPTSALAPGSDLNATVPGYTPTEDGVYTIELIANINEVDANLINDTVTYSTVVTNTYARDNGSVDVLLGVGAGATAVLGNTYEIISPTTLSSVSFFMIPGADGLGDSVRVSIYDVVTGIPASLITQSDLYIISEADTTANGAFLTLPILDSQGAPFNLSAGTYYVGVNEYFTVDNMSLGQSLSIETPNSCFGSINGAAFEPMENFGFPGPFIVRPNFACNVNTVSITECSSYTWSANNETYTESGEYTELFTDVSGCDSLVTLDLTISGPTEGVDVQSACESFTWIDGNTYTENNNAATFLLTDSNGCDSTVTLDLTVHSSTETVDVQSACVPYTWIDGVEYAESNNTATFMLSSVNGCDSLVILDLTIADTIEITDVQISCGEFTWTDGVTYSENNNTAFQSLQSVSGCDSIVTLDLTIYSGDASTDIQSSCGAFTWIDGNVYSESNDTATITLQTVAGCDSIVTLNLTVNALPDVQVDNTDGVLSVASAEGLVYDWIDCLSGVSLGQNDNVFTPTTGGSYQVFVADVESGCADTSECETIEFVELEEVNSFGLNIYPNPSNGLFNIELNSLFVNKIEITVLDVSGKVIASNLFATTSSNLNIPMNMTNVEEGIYFVRISAGKSITKRVVVSHN